MFKKSLPIVYGKYIKCSMTSMPYSIFKVYHLSFAFLAFLQPLRELLVLVGKIAHRGEG